MPDFFESESFVLPSQLLSDVAGRFKVERGIESLELRLSGDALEDTKSFAKLLLDLKKRGVKISHEISIRLDFPHKISRESALSLIENMPKPKNGLVKARIQFDSSANISRKKGSK